MIVRSFALAEWHKNLPDFTVHLDNARSVTFGFVENDQVAKEITLPNQLGVRSCVLRCR